MLLLVGLPIRKESLLWGPISMSIAPNRCIHTADLLLIEFLVHTKTSGMSSGMNTLTSYSIVDCLQNLHMQDSYVW